MSQSTINDTKITLPIEQYQQAKGEECEYISAYYAMNHQDIEIQGEEVFHDDKSTIYIVDYCSLHTLGMFLNAEELNECYPNIPTDPHYQYFCRDNATGVSLYAFTIYGERQHAVFDEEHHFLGYDMDLMELEKEKEREHEIESLINIEDLK